MATLAEQLTSVQAAIAKIEAGAQSYSVDGVTYSRANLETLYKRERDILDRISGSSGQLRTIAQF